MREALRDEDGRQAGRLGRLLSRESLKRAAAPMALSRMQRAASATLPGETLSRNTPLPNDRETATPLARTIFPEESGEDEPILDSVLGSAISDLIEEWSRTRELAAIGVQPNLRCLLYGDPGVGKTILARYIGRRLGLPVLEARLDGLVSSFLGTTARNIGALFDFANRYRCILFLDEFDAVAKARDDVHEVGEIKRVVNALLQCLDVRNDRGFTLAATNHEHLLDPAIWRRFDARIEIGRPDERARRELLLRFSHPLKPTADEVSMLAWLTEGMSGADIETLVTGSKRFLVLQRSSGRRGERMSRSRSMLAGLQRQATLNGDLFGEDRKALLLGPPENLAAACVEGASLTQGAAGSIVGVSQSTVSRCLQERRTVVKPEGYSMTGVATDGQPRPNSVPRPGIPEHEAPDATAGHRNRGTEQGLLSVGQ